MNYIELFAGKGGFRRGLEPLCHECVGWVEWDKYARISYQAIWPQAREEWNANDITTVTDDAIRGLSERVGGVDLIAGGFPCQAFSVAGKRGGFEDTRGTLFFEVARFASILRPKYLLLENVVGLLNHDDGRTFHTILCALDELGYDAEWQVLNATDFGIPQNRERVFIVGHSRRFRGRKVFPLPQTDGEAAAELRLVGLLDQPGHEVRRRIYDPSGSCPTLDTMQRGGSEPKIVTTLNPRKDDGTQSYQHDRVYETDGVMVALSAQMGGRFNIAVSAVLTPDREEKRQNGRRFKEPDEPMFTLTAQDKHGVMVRWQNKQSGAVMDDKSPTLRASGGTDIRKMPHVMVVGNTNPSGHGMNGNVFDAEGLAPTLTTNKGEGNKILAGTRIRKLTPRECWRLMGREDWEFDRAKAAGVSDSQLYKQAGNGLIPQIVTAIAARFEERSD